MSLLRPLYQNNYLPSSPHIYPQRYQENYCTKQDKEVFYGHSFSLSGASSMCRQIKPLAGPLALRTEKYKHYINILLLLYYYYLLLFIIIVVAVVVVFLFCLFFFFFALLLILHALERKQTNKHL